MPTAAQTAALIAAIAFAVLAAAGVYALVRLARLMSEASRAVADFRTRSDLMLGRANSAVDRAHEQLARTDAITANMDEVSTNIAELTADVSTLTGAVHTVLGGPLGRVAGFAFGVRRAIALRRPGPAAAARGRRDPAARAMRADAPAGPAALPAGRIAAPRQASRRRVLR
jgi:uncharacterized protein YoxC